MAKFFFSVPPGLAASGDALSAPHAAAPHAAAPLSPGARRTRRASRSNKSRSPAVILQWEGADGRATGSPIEVQPAAAVALEYPAAGGNMAWADDQAPITFSDEPPEAAVALRLSVPGRAPIRIPRAALTSRSAVLPQPQREMFGPAAARFVVPVFSERFVSKDDFTTNVGGLFEWITSQPPFNREPTRSKIALAAHFWSSDANAGLFHTTDDQSQGGRLFHGDRMMARSLLAPFIGSATVSLILINSTQRGGAGGQPGGFSTWTSITSAPGERWENVCLHEIGHGLGLADEYLDDRLATQLLPTPLEPNVSSSAIPSQTSWRDVVNLPDAPAPSLALNSHDPTPAGAIGTFQGARYRTDLFRPSLNCLMRDTREAFCAICQKHIENVLNAAAPFV